MKMDKEHDLAMSLGISPEKVSQGDESEEYKVEINLRGKQDHLIKAVNSIKTLMGKKISIE